MLYDENGKTEFYTPNEVLDMMRIYGGLMKNLGALQVLNSGVKKGSNIHKQCQEARELYKKNIKKGQIPKDLVDKLDILDD